LKGREIPKRRDVPKGREIPKRREIPKGRIVPKPREAAVKRNGDEDTLLVAVS
jgi:hypothetical protein